MLLQPLVENAVKHGIGGSISGGTIKISCIREGRHAKIIISDTGAGFKGDLQLLERTEGIGLKIPANGYSVCIMKSCLWKPTHLPD
ncbi:hypothetical protein [Paraflavitalea speifideaquila]|uniref:hypothetical protein n=1 Tax=Paraflavitalea speifideaquila TaxID=3076558 RepID=UPI0028E8E53C|nr:hypothetical protein [Paraflavitalea speifideiaquila]